MPEVSRSNRVSSLKERVIAEIGKQLVVPTDDEKYLTPTEAALRCGLHPRYIMNAMIVGDLDVSLRKMNVLKGDGPQKLVSMSIKQLTRWYDEHVEAAEEEGVSLSEYLTDKYSMDVVYPMESPKFDMNIPSDVPSDLVPVDVAKQMVQQYGITEAQLEAALEASEVTIYEIEGEPMASESELSSLVKGSEGRAERDVIDLGESCSLEAAAEAVNVSPQLLQAAFEACDCHATFTEDGWFVDFCDVVYWYNEFYADDEGPGDRLQLIDLDGSPVNPTRQIRSSTPRTHYSTELEVCFLVPDIPVIVEGINEKILCEAHEQQLTYPPDATVQVGQSVSEVDVRVVLPLETLNALCYLAHQGGHDLDTYVTLVAHDQS